MFGEFSPALILILGAIVSPLLKGSVQKLYLLLLPVLSGVQLLGLEPGLHGQFEIFQQTLVWVRVDQLSLVWGYIFHIAALIGVVYALHLRDNVQQMASLIYAGAAIGGVLAGDLLTLFLFWELTAISSSFLIFSSRTNRAYRAGIRYLIIQIGSGLILLLGIAIHLHEQGSIAFYEIGLQSIGALLIFVAFGIKCAFPLLHNWLQDAYPEATVTGTVFLSAFTTKLAVYALARGFPGTEILVPIGAAMTVFPIFYAVIENDLRRVLAYSLNNQLGFMVVGIGIGTELSLNGTAAHAFTHILYKALLFMSMGAILYRTGTIKASQLGGLYKSMPWTTAFCIVGTLSIAGLPWFSGFISKSLIVSAAADGHYMLGWFALLFASAAALHPYLKVPFLAFFAQDAGIRCREAPGNMLFAMGLTASLCVLIGIFPGFLYSILPYAVDYEPYTPSHVLTQLQLLFFSALAFTFLKRSGLYPPEQRSVNLDSDWLYRRLVPSFIRIAGRGISQTIDIVENRMAASVSALMADSSITNFSKRFRSVAQGTGSSVQLVLVLLSAYLLYFIVQHLLGAR